MNFNEYIKALRQEYRPELFEEFRKMICNGLDKYTLRQLVSISDTFIDYGTEIEKRSAMFISVFANMVKLADSYLDIIGTEDLSSMNLEYKNIYKDKLYDDVLCFNFRSGDMFNNMLYRMNDLLIKTPILLVLFEEIKAKIKEHSILLNKIAPLHENFYDVSFYKGRKSFR